jgi:hypothetical protein
MQHSRRQMQKVKSAIIKVTGDWAEDVWDFSALRECWRLNGKLPYELLHVGHADVDHFERPPTSFIVAKAKTWPHTYWL